DAVLPLRAGAATVPDHADWRGRGTAPDDAGHRRPVRGRPPGSCWATALRDLHLGVRALAGGLRRRPLLDDGIGPCAPDRGVRRGDRTSQPRSEERRVGKECGARGWRWYERRERRRTWEERQSWRVQRR